MNIKEDNFKFFAPVELIKGKNKEGVTVMKMQGIASTGAQDSDKEFLNPKGFELDYFMKHGFMNWNHQTNKNPLAIIGRPTEASVVKGKLNLSCELFDHNPLAKDVYKLAEVLSSQGLNLGYSIEGKVIERDSKDPRKVLKAQITGCAITPNPKNQETVANIVKGYDSEGLDIIKGMYSAYEDATEEEREKALTAGSESGQAVSKESLDGNIKDLTNKSKKKKKMLSKGEVLDHLMKSFPNNKVSEVNEIYALIEQIEKSEQMKKQEISQDSIDKAFEALGISKGSASEELEVTEEVVAEEAQEETTEEVAEEAVEDLAEVGSLEEIEKGEDSEIYMSYKGEKYMYKKEDCYEKGGKMHKMHNGKMEIMEDEEEKVEKAKKDEDPCHEDHEMVGAKNKDGKEAPNCVPKKEIKKGKEDELGESSTEELIKGISNMFGSQFDVMTKNFDEKFASLGVINKGLENQISDLSNRLKEYENTPNQPKSITTKKYIEKSHSNGSDVLGEGVEEKNTMSVSLHKAQILNILDKESGISSGTMTDPVLANDVIAYEASGAVSQRIHKVMIEKGITLTK